MYLKMLGLYLYTLIIGHKSCKMLSILNKLTLFVTQFCSSYCNVHLLRILNILQDL